MTPFLVVAVLFLWDVWWNAILNVNHENKRIYWEQIVVSMFVALGIQSINEWSGAAAGAVVSLLSLAYYINLIHIRFFGHMIPFFQIRQFFQNGTASVVIGMLLQAARRLIRPSDLIFLAVLLGTLAVICTPWSHAAMEPVIKWSLADAFLLLLIAFTLAQYPRIKDGTVEPRRFGMLLSYLYSSLVERNKRRNNEVMVQALAASHEINEKKSEAPNSEDPWFGKYKGKNVIFIQLESFQQFLLHHKVEGQEVTPFLNQLANENISFTEIYSQFAMGHTSDVELAVLHSLYPLKNEIVNYKHFDKTFFGLPKILRKHGYHANAYHGYKGDFYNRRTMMKTHGFESFYAEEDYQLTEVASSWLSDFSFFEQSARMMKRMKKPFFSFLISLTSHFPFQLEERHRNLKLSEEVPEFLASYFQSVHYTDRALRHFFDCLQQEGLMENTIIALYGDHEGVTIEHQPSLNQHLGIKQSDNVNGIQQILLGKVPFIIVSGDPNDRVAHRSNVLGSPLDIGQTIMHLLGLPTPSYGMGENLFQAAEDRTIPLAKCPLGSFVTKDLICFASQTGTFSDSALYDYKAGEFVSTRHPGENEARFNFSKQQMLLSEYLIRNDLLVEQESDATVESTEETEDATFTPAIERIVNIVNDDAVIFPLTMELDKVYFEGQDKNPENMLRLEQYYKKKRKKNICFYSTFDLARNDKPIYFEDQAYISVLQENGYAVDSVNPVSLPVFLDGLPDHAFIIVSGKDEAANQFKHEFVRTMKEYGFHNLNTSKIRHSYINVIYKNKGFFSLFEAVSVNGLEKNWKAGSLLKGVRLPFELAVLSKGHYAGNESQIRVRGIPCSRNLRGLNFAVADAETGEIVSGFRADTFTTTNVDSGMYFATKESMMLEVNA